MRGTEKSKILSEMNNRWLGTGEGMMHQVWGDQDRFEGIRTRFGGIRFGEIRTRFGGTRFEGIRRIGPVRTEGWVEVSRL